MPTVETTIRIEAPPEVVARVLLDIDLAPAWTTGLERLELVSGEPGKPGCVGHAHYLEHGRRSVLVDVLEQVTPCRHYRSRITGGGLTAVVETTLTPVSEDKTLMSIRWVGSGTSLVTRIVLPLMKRRLARRMDVDLIALRQLAEARVS